MKWKKIVEEIESLRQLAAFEKKQRLTVEAEKAGEGGSDKEVEVRKYEKKKRSFSISSVHKRNLGRLPRIQSIRIHP